ncbi:MAG: COX15/CtaA family protein [Halopseudomonas sp.]
MLTLSLSTDHSQQPVQTGSSQLPLRLARIGVCLALVVVLLGGWTRLNDAGLSCPDWPGCYGELILPASDSGQALAQSRYPQLPLDLSRSWIEMSHRYLAGSLGLLVAALTLSGWRQRAQPGYPFGLSVLLLGLVTLQALFGMWTVTLKLLPQIVTLHLLGGLLTLTLLLRLQQRLRLHDLPNRKLQATTYTRWVGVGVMLLLLQVGLGGWTSSNYAGWSCSHWFVCEQDKMQTLDFDAGFTLPPLDGRNYQGGQLPLPARAAIQMSHRGVGLLLAAYLVGLGAVLFSQLRLRRASLAVVSVVALQLVLGGLNVHFGLPLWLAFAHHAGAVALLVTLLGLYGQTRLTEENEHG